MNFFYKTGHIKKSMLIISVLALIFVVTLIVAISTISEYIQKYDSKSDFYVGWDTNRSGEVVITKYIGSKRNVRIPPSIQNLPVTSIGFEAFAECASITSVTIPNSVTSIGFGAFFGCTNLTSITIPDSVTSIGGWAFLDCTNLTSVTIPDSVTSIEAGTFAGCTSLTSLTIPNSAISIGRSAFADCTNLTNVTIPNSVTSIGDSFSGCINLASVTIIGNDALNTSRLIILDNVTSVGEMAFRDCTNLVSLTIGSGVTSIGRGAFSSCTNLTSVTFKGTISSDNFNNSAFQFLGDLRSKYLSEGIGKYTRNVSSETWTKSALFYTETPVCENVSFDNYETFDTIVLEHVSDYRPDNRTARRMSYYIDQGGPIPSNIDLWKIFDNRTITDLERNVNLQWTLRQMIIEHIRAIEGVDDVSLNIVWPKKEFLLTNQPPVTASAIIIPKSESDITKNRKKIEGIQKLLKLAIENLHDENIIITDQYGAVLNNFE